MCLSDTSLSAIADVLHGVEIEDPYRWLEERARPETGVWIASQQLRCAEYFTESASLTRIRQRVRDYLDVEVVDQVAQVGRRRFYRRRARGCEQASLYVYDCVTREERILVDPATLGPFASVRIHRIASSSPLLAYELKFGGGDRKSIHFVDVENGFTLPDSIEDGYARGFAFSTDDRSFYCCHETQESKDHRIVHRTLGEARDEVIFRIAHESGSRLMLIADDIHLGAIHIHRTDGEDSLDLWIADRSEATRWHRVLVNRSLPYTPILSFGRVFAFTYEQSPNGRLTELDLNGDEIRTVIPEAEGMTREFLFVGQTIFKSRVGHMCSVVERWSAAGEHLGNLDVPNSVSVRLHAAQSETVDRIFLTTESVTQPPCILACSVATGKFDTWHDSGCPTFSHACPVQRNFFVSKDGTSVPITLVVPKHERSGQPTTLMTSYGGFAVDAAPRFSVLQAVLIELGVTVAIPHIRGGGEFGRSWHEAARGGKRQTAFDDFLGAAEWIYKNGLAAPHRLAIFGGSNGGLLVAAAMTQRPELFRAVLCIAPLLDMVRYEVFDHAKRWRQEYGTVDDRQDFQTLYTYSPYHHVEEAVDYPSVMFVSGDQDDRCNPAHVRKMAARLQKRESQHHPVIVDYSDERGHSPVLPLSVRIDALARRIQFLCRELEIPVIFGGGHEASGA